MRILVDQSGYDLLNLGDVAMLQSCVARLWRQWPDAEIMVVAHSPERLASYCPGTQAIGRTFADLPVIRAVPRRPRLASEQAWKAAAPYLRGHALGGRRVRPRPGRPRTAVQAVHAADIVVASGGGYVTDTWWWHAAGVLSLLAMAQRLGKPTAMFGQGIGPIGMRALHAQARAVLPRLAVLGLREARLGAELALSLGTPPAAIRVTGDDALEIATATSVAAGDALGVNIRLAGYAGTDGTDGPAVAEIGTVLTAVAASFRAPIVGLPVSRYEPGTDLAAIRSLLGHQARNATLRDLAAPGELAAAVATCRAVVTGSYHAAVFALAQGIPVVCLTKSRYYDVKFAGLRALFPSACSVVSLAAPGLSARLRAAIDEAWHLPIAGRAAAHQVAACQRQAGREAYRQFRDAVENGTGNGTALARTAQVTT